VVRRLNPGKRKDYGSKHEYHGYVPARQFEAFARKHLELLDEGARRTQKVTDAASAASSGG
jgi:hypothetical protein